MKRKFKTAIIVIGLIAAWWFMSLLPLEDYYTSHAQSAYPPPPSDALLNPYPPPPTDYPGPQEPRATPSSVPTSEPELTSISITISVVGLKEGDEAQSSLLPFTEGLKAQVQSVDAVLPSITLSDGDHTVKAENIPTGIYKLIIQTSSEYFRNPKGFIIRVSEAGAALPQNQILQFNVVPTNMNALPPCRNITVNKNTSSFDPDICMAEWLVDIAK